MYFIVNLLTMYHAPFAIENKYNDFMENFAELKPQLVIFKNKLI